MKRKKDSVEQVDVPAQSGHGGSHNDMDLPEEFTLIEGREQAQHRRREEREGQRRVAAEAKRKRQLRSSRKGDNVLTAGNSQQPPEGSFVLVAVAEHEASKGLNTREHDPFGSRTSKQLIKDESKIRFGNIDMAQLPEKENASLLSGGTVQDAKLPPSQASDQICMLVDEDSHEQTVKYTKMGLIKKEVNTRFGSLGTPDLVSAAQSKNVELSFQEADKSIPKSELLDDSIVKFLTARERSKTLETLHLGPSLPCKVKEKQKSRVHGSLDNRVQVMLLKDLPDPHHASAMDFRHERLFGSHRRRSYSMLKKFPRASALG